jgi:hypothetical protein
MKPKEFIENVLINEIKDVVDRHAYLSFLLIAVGIEFLGKCLLIEKPNWNDIKPDAAFKKGMELICEIEPEYSKHNLKDELRNGFAHTLSPKSKIALSEIKHGAKNFQNNNSGQTILVAEIFYRDFVIACRHIIEKEFPKEDKMNKDFLYVGK